MPVMHASCGPEELRRARAQSRGLYWAVGIFSLFVNLLMLTGPLYMLNVYDRVLGSRAVETLVALSVLVAFLFLMMGLLDHVRGRIMGRVAARFQDRLDGRVFAASLRAADMVPVPVGADSGLRDLESVQRLLASPVLLAAFDLPWAPLFLCGIFIFHPALGWLALAGAAVLVVAALLNQRLAILPLTQAGNAAQRAEARAREIRQEAETVQALGMRGAAFARWRTERATALAGAITAADLGGSVTAAIKAFRLFLQSAMLGLGAWLVLRGELSPGAMIAGSILLGRALAPVETIVGQWPVFQRAREGWSNLGALLSAVPSLPSRTALPRPAARIGVEQATVIPPGGQQAVLRMLGFAVEPGQAVGVIGPSGAGKSTLARALTGTWRLAGGSIRLDGATLDQYDPDVLGRLIGYLPQRVTLFEGTIAENIARLDRQRDDAAVVRAAQQAAAHEMILRMPEGYDTPLAPQGGRLSGGEIQRIGLARALYGDPVMLVLDEPNSNLDNDGTEALNTAIRHMKATGRCVFIMAHRPAAIQECDMLLVIEGGTRRAYGPRDDVLRDMVQNHREIRSGGRGGVA